MAEIIDVSYQIGSYAGYLAGAGVRTVIRYYSRDTGHPSKRLSKAEAGQLAAAGLMIGIVHEARRGDLITSFSHSLGVLDAEYALGYGRNVIGQPNGSAIYFGVDFDASAKQVANEIEPYFQGIASVMHNGSNPAYLIGVYGSGRVCAALQDAGLVDRTWLAQSTGWSGFQSYDQSGKWALKQGKVTKIGEIECDVDVAGADDAGFGDFLLSASASIAPFLDTIGPRRVNAGPGLRVRAGAGTNFDVIEVLPFGKMVLAIKAVGDWTLVDTNGDGATDGFVSSHFLSE